MPNEFVCHSCLEPVHRVPHKKNCKLVQEREHARELQERLYASTTAQRLQALAKRVTCHEVHEGTLCRDCRREDNGCLRSWALHGEWPDRVRTFNDHYTPLLCQSPRLDDAQQQRLVEMALDCAFDGNGSPRLESVQLLVAYVEALIQDAREKDAK